MTPIRRVLESFKIVRVQLRPDTWRRARSGSRKVDRRLLLQGHRRGWSPEMQPMSHRHGRAGV